jgi:hypothetical protein
VRLKLKIPQPPKMLTLGAIFGLTTLGIFYAAIFLFGVDAIFASAWSERFAIILPFLIGGVAAFLGMWLIYGDSGFIPKGVTHPPSPSWWSYIIWIVVAVILVALFS